MKISTYLKHLLFSALFFLFMFQAQAQTTFSGGIYTATTWTAAGSPYIINGDVTVFPGASLTIEPGVDIRFEDDVLLTIRNADLIAEGTETDSIRFISNSSDPDNNSWKGISLEDSTFCSLSYCRISHAAKAIDGVILTSYDPGTYLIFSHIVFSHNFLACDLASNVVWLHADQCRFEYNYTFGISSLGPIMPELEKNNLIENCYFTNNGNAIGDGQNSTIINCIFCSNVWWACYGADTLLNCTFINNAEYALTGTVNYARNNVFTGNDLASSAHLGDVFTDNYFFDNDIAIEVSGTTGDVIDMTGNYACGNTTNLTTNSDQNFSVINLCFCESDSAVIAASVVDGYDDVSKGLISFSPYIMCDESLFDTLTVASCDGAPTGLFAVPGSAVNTLNLYPNPFENTVNMALPDGDNWTITVRNALGQIEILKEIMNNENAYIDASGLPAGAYIISASDGTKIYSGYALKVKN